MAIATHPVGPAPSDVRAALGLDGARVFENLGERALRFVVAAAAGEAAPLDPDAGHLLLPGARETVRATAGEPVWVWSAYPTRLGVGPAWQGGTSIGATLFESAALPTAAVAGGSTIPNIAWSDGDAKPSWIDTSVASRFEIRHAGESPPDNVIGIWIRARVGKSTYKGRRLHEWRVHTTSAERIDLDFGEDQSVRFRVQRTGLHWRFYLEGNGGSDLPAKSRIEVTWAISG